MCSWAWAIPGKTGRCLNGADQVVELDGNCRGKCIADDHDLEAVIKGGTNDVAAVAQDVEANSSINATARILRRRIINIAMFSSI